MLFSYLIHWLSSLSRSGLDLLSSRLKFCWNFFMSKTLYGWSGFKTPLGNFRMSLLTALSSVVFFTDTAAPLGKNSISTIWTRLVKGKRMVNMIHISKEVTVRKKCELKFSSSSLTKKRTFSQFKFAPYPKEN